MNHKYKAITIVVFLLVTLICPVNGQVVVEISNEKTIISGKQFFLHTVKKGETAYSISRAYNISIEELTQNNPSSVFLVKEGETLLIPYKDILEETTPQNLLIPIDQKDENLYEYHILQSGETVFSLSRLYGVAENEIINANPNIDITNLSIGMEIAVPKRDFKIVTQNFVVQDTSFFFHKVKKGENLSSIADYYGITLRNLRRENRNVRFPSEGDMIKIPSEYAKKEFFTESSFDYENIEITDSISFEVASMPTVITSLEGSLDVAVLLPLFLKENSIRYDIDSSRYLNGRKVYKTVPRQEEWIYSRSIGFIEMYEGILMAADSLRSLGLTINLHTYDITNNNQEMRDLINQGKLDNVDLIIGPVYSSNLAIVSDFASSRDIPVVSPVQLMSDELVKGNPTLFIANPFINVSQDDIARKVGEYYNGNIVFIHTDTAGTDPQVNEFKNKILQELSTKIPYEEIRFKEYLYYSKSAFNNDSINRLGHAISKNFENVVVIASEDNSVISETLQEIHTLSKNNNIHVFGYPVIRSMNNIEPRYLFDLDLFVFSPFWIDYSNKNVRSFIESYYNRFLMEPEEMSYAWLGYDIAFYFMSGLSLNGKEFIANPDIHNPDLLQTNFKFRRENVNDGFENLFLFPIRYTKDYDVELDYGMLN
jgi:LysM repeat protein